MAYVVMAVGEATKSDDPNSSHVPSYALQRRAHRDGGNELSWRSSKRRKKSRSRADLWAGSGGCEAIRLCKEPDGSRMAVGPGSHQHPRERSAVSRASQLSQLLGLCGCGLYRHGLYEYGPHSHGLHSHGLYSYGLYSNGLCGYGLCSHGVAYMAMAFVAMAYVVLAHVVMAYVVMASASSIDQIRVPCRYAPMWSTSCPDCVTHSDRGLNARSLPKEFSAKEKTVARSPKRFAKSVCRNVSLQKKKPLLTW